MCMYVMCQDLIHVRPVFSHGPLTSPYSLVYRSCSNQIFPLIYNTEILIIYDPFMHILSSLPKAPRCVLPARLNKILKQDLKCPCIIKKVYPFCGATCAPFFDSICWNSLLRFIVPQEDHKKVKDTDHGLYLLLHFNYLSGPE